ncbi:MAG TPA: insulinase family protein [Croceibacterium sp.]
MRYALARNTMPSGGAAIRFTIDAGRRDERDDEAGFAHFLEHMAFNGSSSIPEGQLVPMLERLGLAFGPDANAETGFEHTSYLLNLPRTDEATVEAALTIMRETASELTLPSDAVDCERGVLASEHRARDTPERRRTADLLSAAVPGGRLGERMAGELDGLDTLTADRLRAFYQAYYRPENATLVIVGDFDPAAMEVRIVGHFADWRGAGESRQPFVTPSAPRQAAVDTFSDPSIPEAVELLSVSPYTPPANSLAEQRERALRAVAARALSNRLVELSRGADSPSLGGQAAIQDLFRSANIAGVSVGAKDGQWRAAAMMAEQQLRGALQHGFTLAEVTEAKANLAASFENLAAQWPAMPSSLKAQLLSQASLSDGVPVAPAASLEAYRDIADSITPASVTEAFRQAWVSGVDLVHVSTKGAIEGGDEAVAAAFAESGRVAVAAPVQGGDAVRFAYDDFGPAGAVMSDTRIADLAIRSIAFANGTRLNLKRTDFEPARIAFQMHVGNGLAGFPKDKPGLPQMMGMTMALDGLQAHGIDELRRLLAGRQVSLAFAPGTDALIAAGTTTPQDVELQLKLLAARLAASGFRPETQAQWQGAAPVLAQGTASTAQRLLSLALNHLLAGGDGRFGAADPMALTQRSLDELRATIEPQLLHGAVDVGLVGDFDEDTAIAAFARTLGALPPRDPTPATAGNPPRFTTERGPLILNHSGPADQAMVALAWPTDDGSDLAGQLQRAVLAQVFQIRLTETLRESLGATYTPQAVAYSTPEDDDFGYLGTLASVDPARLEAATGIMRSIAAELVGAEVSADLLQRARQPIQEGMRAEQTQNGSWSSIVARAHRNPDHLDRRRRRDAVLAAIMPADLQAQARRFLTEDPVEIRVVSKPVEE